MERCPSGSALYRDPDGFAEALRGAIARVCAGGSKAQLAAIGLAGPMDVDLAARVLDEVLPGVPRHVYAEGDIARGLYDLRAGVALVAGTGCSCSAVNEAGELLSLGGYGPQFGDEGSGYWIACEALKAAFLAEQGRIPPTPLLDAARAFFGVKSPWDIHREASGTGHVPAPRIAAFAAAVDPVAEGGDACAARILSEAGAHLARLVVETAARAGIAADPVPLVMTGGALRSARTVSALKGVLAAAPIAFHMYPIVHEPIAGLIRLLQRATGARTLDHVS